MERAFRQRSAFHVFPDVIPALNAMREAGLRLGVVSNWGWAAPELLQTLELAQHFEVLSVSARVGYQKPHPAIFFHALELLGVTPRKPSTSVTTRPMSSARAAPASSPSSSTAPAGPTHPSAGTRPPMASS